METVNRLRRWLGIDIQAAKLIVMESMIKDQCQRIHTLEGELYDFKQALKAKVTASVFDSDKIPDKSGRVSYVPVARRRAQAEAASLGPKTHGDKVRDNNIRAIESAG